MTTRDEVTARKVAQRLRGYPYDADGLNDDRAKWAGKAIEVFIKEVGMGEADDFNALSDLLANLMHWADRNGHEFDAEFDRARRNYLDETHPF